MKIRLVGALCALLLSAPALAQPPEPRYEMVREDYNAAVLTTGAVVFATSYGASVVAAATASDENAHRGFENLYVPVAGPWMALTEYDDCPITRPSCDDETTVKVLLIADGLFQAAGALAMIHGLLEPSSRSVAVRATKVDTKIRIRPTATKGNPGLALVGRF